MKINNLLNSILKHNIELKRLLVKSQSLFIKDKRLRKRWKSIKLKKIVSEVVLGCKWGVSYSVFDNEELLEHSIRHIREHVEYINVVYQQESWYGNPAKETLIPKLLSMKESGLIDELIEYKSNPSIKASIQEINKRNIGLAYAQKARVDYFMTMDCDEFYEDEEMEKAKYFIIDKGITRSFVDVFNYFSPTLRYLAPTPSYVNFFSKINRRSKLISKNPNIITLVDPTRSLNDTGNEKYYFLHGIAMHHMTHYRKDIVYKIINSTARDAHKLIPEPVNCAQVKDIFNIDGVF